MSRSCDLLRGMRVIECWASTSKGYIYINNQTGKYWLIDGGTLPNGDCAVSELTKAEAKAMVVEYG